MALSFLNDAFLTTNNLLNVLRQASLVFFMASGLTLVILTGKIDLSVGATVGLSACLAATIIKSTGSPWLGGVVGIGAGILVGLANGVMVTRLRIPSFIATYGSLWIVQGITYYYMAGQTIYGFPPGFRALGSGYALGIPIPVYLMAGFLLIGSFFAKRTTYGQQIYAIGANSVAARLSGIPVNSRLVLVFINVRGNGGARVARIPRAPEFRGGRHRRVADIADDRSRIDWWHVTIRRHRHRVRYLLRSGDPDSDSQRHESACG